MAIKTFCEFREYKHRSKLPHEEEKEVHSLAWIATAIDSVSQCSSKIIRAFFCFFVCVTVHIITYTLTFRGTHLIELWGTARP